MQYNRADSDKFECQDGQTQKNENNQKRKSRRTKKDQEGRSFSCPCGKSYLSYPALYTHVKTKHQGKSGFLQLKLNKQASGTCSKISQKQKQNSKNYIVRMSKVLNNNFSQQNCNWIYSSNISSQISQFIDKIMAQHLNESQPIPSPSNNKFNHTIDKMIFSFLSQIKDLINQQALAYLHLFFFYFTNFVNGLINKKKELGVVKKEENNEYKQDQDIEMKTITCNELPNYFNQFILQKKVPHIETENRNLKHSLVLCCKIILELGAWMHEEAYTQYSLKINYPNSNQ